MSASPFASRSWGSDPFTVETYAQEYRAEACERCGGGRIDYRLSMTDGSSVERVCWPCCRTSLALSPQAREAK